jgi:hypothetical protein
MSETKNYQNELLEILQKSSAICQALSLLIKSANDLGEISATKIINQLASLISMIDNKSLSTDIINPEEIKSILLNLIVDFQYQDRLNQTLQLVMCCINESTAPELITTNQKDSDFQVESLNIKLQAYKNISQSILNGTKSIQPNLFKDIEKTLNVTKM